MKKHVVNKNIMHNGKPYVKDSSIKESDEGFKMLHDAGHISSISFEDEAASEVAPELPSGEDGKKKHRR